MESLIPIRRPLLTAAVWASVRDLRPSPGRGGIL